MERGGDNDDIVSIPFSLKEDLKTAMIGLNRYKMVLFGKRICGILCLIFWVYAFYKSFYIYV